jgi:hypothetical protein
MYSAVVGLDVRLRGDRVTAILGWVVAGVVMAAAAVSVVTNDPIWGGFSLTFVALIAFPAIAAHDWTAMAPWPVLTVGALAVTARIAGVYPEAAGYVAIATLALVIVVELDVFTSIHLSRRFAVSFAALTTLAIEAVWIIVQFFSDQWLGTGYLSTQTELQEDIVIVTVVGFIMGGLFYWYLARFEPIGLDNVPSVPEENP